MAQMCNKADSCSAQVKRNTVADKARGHTSRSSTFEPNDNQIANPPAYRTIQDILCKSEKGRSTIHGDTYHLRLAIMIILRAYRTHQLDHEFSFTVAVEVAAAGKFDDILYHYATPTTPAATGTWFMQAKHKQQTDGHAGNVSQPKRSSVRSNPNGGSTVTEKALLAAWNSKSAYSIPMYFVSFLEIDHRLPNESRYVLCTNASLDKNISSRFTIIDPQPDNAFLFCADIGATCYQFARDKPFTQLVDTLRDTCLAKLGQVFAESIFAEKIVTVSDTLVNTFSGFLHACLVPLQATTNDSPSVSSFKFSEAFFNAPKSTLIGTFQIAFRNEYKTLVTKAKQKYDRNGLHKLRIKIDGLSFESGKRPANMFAKFDKKVQEFCAKFVLVCNSSNDEALRAKAMTLLSRWYDADPGTVFDMLQGVLLDALKSGKRVPLDQTFMQQFFVDLEHRQSVSSLKSFSEQYVRSIQLEHSQVEVDPQYLKRSSVHSFLQNKSAFGVYQYNSMLELTVSSYILLQMLSHSSYDTLFVDSAKYGKAEDMKAILDGLLSYLKAGNHPTIKVITVLGKHEQVSITWMKELAKKHCSKIVVVEKIADVPKNAGPLKWYVGDNLKHEAWSKLCTDTDLLIFGSVTPLSRIVDETDDVSFRLALLKLGKQDGERQNHNMHQLDYDNIKTCYIHRCVVPYQADTDVHSSRFHKYASRSKTDLIHSSARNTQEKEPDPPGTEHGSERKVHIFLNDAGHGKTYYFTWLAWRLAAYDRSLYVIKFSGREFTADFGRLEANDVENLSETEIVRLLYSYLHLGTKRPIKVTASINREESVRGAHLLTVSNGQIVLRKDADLSTEELIKVRLFRDKFNQQKIVLILDGFDEIVPCCTDVVMFCFERFVRLRGVRSLYLSSRAYGFEHKLTNTFQHCQLYELKPFSLDDLVHSWRKFLQMNLNRYESCFLSREPSTLYALCSRLTNRLHDVITVPQILHTVQTILLPQIKTLVTVNPDSGTLGALQLNTFDLVKRIVDKMMDTLRLDIIDTTFASLQDSGVGKCIGSASGKINDRHMLLAMHAIFAERDRQKLLSKAEQKRADQLLEKLSQGNAGNEFVLGAVNGEPVFVHFIFAEYFAAHWFYQNRDRFRAERIIIILLLRSKIRVVACRYIRYKII